MKKPINTHPKNSTGSDNLQITMTKSPNAMSKSERIAAIGSILAAGLLRLKSKKRRKEIEE